MKLVIKPSDLKYFWELINSYKKDFCGPKFWIQYNNYNDGEFCSLYYTDKTEDKKETIKELSAEQWNSLVCEIADYNIMLKLTKLSGVTPAAKYIALEIMK